MSYVWLLYLIAHFVAPWAYVLNGEVRYSGESDGDEGVISVARFDRTPQLFTLQGSLRQTCLLECIQYRAEVA